MRSSYQAQMSPYARFASSDQLHELHLTSLEILRSTGTLVLEAEAQSLLKKAGVRVGNDGIARIPSHLVKIALQSAPPRVALADRTGEPSMFLEGHNVYYGPGLDCPSIVDLETDKIRPAVLKDVEQNAVLCDFLPHIDYAMSFALASDAPTTLSDRFHFKAMVAHTRKPICFTAWDKQGLADIVEMAAAVSGSMERLQDDPFVILYCEMISPLKHAKDGLEKLLFCADHGIPVIYTTGGMGGATMPATLAGSLAVANAEMLSGLVIHQLKRPGAPFVYGGTLTIMDPASMRFLHGAPEFYINQAVLAELATYYELPMWGAAGCSDSKVFDQQAASEATYGILMAALCGVNLVHDVGYLENSMIASQELLVASDEIIGMVDRIMQGVRITNETLALSTIAKVGPGGTFIAEKHTADNFRKEFWFPGLFDRRGYEEWEARGSKTMGQRTKDKVHEILNQHTPEPLPIKIVSMLDQILERASSNLKK